MSGPSEIPAGPLAAGWNLRDAGKTVGFGQAQDVLDVLGVGPDAIEQRPGYAYLTAALTLDECFGISPFLDAAGDRIVIAGVVDVLGTDKTVLRAYDTAGVLVDSGGNAIITADPFNFSFARFGSPTETALYIASGTQDEVQKFDGTVFSEPTITLDGVVSANRIGQARAVGVWPGENRLLVGGIMDGTYPYGGAFDHDDSLLVLSEAGAPESFLSTDFIRLRPGDGEYIAAIAAWRDVVLIFKQTAFWVLTGSYLDADQASVFQRYAVEAGVGVEYPQQVCVSPEGVFFFTRHGIYVTTGKEPVRISDLIEPFWHPKEAGIHDFCSSDFFNQSQLHRVSMAFHDRRLYVAVPTGTATYADRILVFDTRTNSWWIYSLDCQAISAWDRDDEPELVLSVRTGANSQRIAYHKAGITLDDIDAIVGIWRSGWGNFGRPEIKTIRASKVWGVGSVQYELLADYDDADVAGGVLALGDAAGPLEPIRPAYDGDSQRGTVFQVRLRSVLGEPWRVIAISHLVQDLEPGVQRDTTA